MNTVIEESRTTAVELLDAIVSSVGGTPREGQLLMAAESEKAIMSGKNIVVAAGTGVGKSFAYIAAGLAVRDPDDPKPIVIVTATKALQEQLDRTDLPVVSKVFEELYGRPLVYMKALGVSNFLCNLQVKETLEKVEKGDYDMDFEDEEIMSWAKETETGEMSELSFEPSSKTWGNFSVSSGECLGKTKCPEASNCYAMDAREQYQFADVVVANTALYAIYLQTGMTSNILPDHDVVIFDECHKLADSVRGAMSKRLTKFGIARMGKLHGTFFEGSDIENDFEKLADRFEKQIENRYSEDRESLVRLRNMHSSNPEVVKTLVQIVELADSSSVKIMKELRSNPNLKKLQTRGEQALKAIDNFKESISLVVSGSAGDPNKVTWITKENTYHSLNMSDINVGEFLQETLWDSPVDSILCSATVPASLEKDIGLDGAVRVDAPSPFNYRDNAYLYIPKGMPPGNDKDNFFDATLEPIEDLIRLAKGRTLLLFTSWKAMNETYDVMEKILGKEFIMMKQGQKPKGLLVDEFKQANADGKQAVLFGTQSFWEGISINGDSCVSVIIDKIPFSSPMDPIYQAIRENAGQKAFFEVDIPNAATTLAQGVGRLIRTIEDRGIVTVLDSRLAEKNYRDKILEELPPMRRLRSYDHIKEFLEKL